MGIIMLKRFTNIVLALLTASACISTASCSKNVEANSSNTLGGLNVSGTEKSDAVGAEHFYTETTSAVTTAPPETTTSTTTTVTTTAPQFIKGDICDVNGKMLLSTDLNSGVRIYDQNYRISFANILDATTSDGFDAALSDTLSVPNPTPVNGRTDYAQSVRLTLNADLQNAIYQYMQANNLIGSAVVMRTDGSVLSEVSYPSYDPDLYRADHSYANTLIPGTFFNRAFQNASPGSCFKIISAMVADMNGIESLTDEGNWVDSGTAIHNWDWDTAQYSYPMQRDLVSAVAKSSNVFFAKAFQMVGAENVLTQLREYFMFANDTPIECDFGPIENNIEVYCNDDLRRSGFGQAHVRTCPLYLAALCREAVYGDMVRPFVLSSCVDTNDLTTPSAEGSKPYDVIASVPAEYRDSLLEGMLGVTSHLGIYIPEGYTLYTKTGTAEVGSGDYLYITGCLKNNADNTDSQPVFTDYSDYGNNGSYIIVMQIQNPKEHNFAYASDSAAYYKGIIDLVLSY
ncbi:MAG: peptidoglycan glycosyltransferase [Ruminococcus flavefaciens]|jgi:cell division protein FtsI/penicillin-binding protein 2|nr:peptidoglycan glycosyltransferase [Ruminococcus flavefaciens]